ncbi:MAG: type II toxin-antitoxin system PemK/MazF family toxin [Dehalococcoidales bacterium]|nr:MAG: type II toxin-antitoxin system PemK/MazF family toxin [Dehalococcoidales bacterium]
MKRGEIWWAEFVTPAGRRPVLLLSRDEAYMVRELVTVAPITTRIRNIPSEVPLDLEDGLPKPCVINLDTVTTITKSILSDRLTALSVKKIKAVETALRFALGMES